MPVPADIRAVPRPVNTVVRAYGKNSDKYAVYQRVGCHRVNGKNVPVEGGVVGHIIDHQYVPLPEIPVVSASSSPQLKSWADITLCDRLFRPILNELEAVYNPKDAIKLYVMAILMVCDPGITYSRMKEAYEESFLSELYPDTPLSRNTVSAFLEDLGKQCSQIFEFMRNRAAKIKMDDRVIIDGTLKSNDSTVNSLSNFSRKAKLKGRKDISILFAFDTETNEPVCSQCYPGNMLDQTAYDDFIQKNKLEHGVVIGDKGFPAAAIEQVLEKNPGLHYLNPIRRNSKVIATHKMTEFEGILPCDPGVTYKKAKVNGKDKWLYAYRDAAEAHEEEQGWLAQHAKEGDFDRAEYEKKKATFGTIVLESDLDMDPETIYKMYTCRWEIEIVMRFYKSALDFKDVRVHNDYSVMGAEFVDFLASVLTFKLINCFDAHKLLEEYTYKELMHRLDLGKKIQLEGKWQLIKLNPSIIKLYETVELLEKPEPPAPKKRGRPRTKPLPDPNQPKPKRGRPKKKPSPESETGQAE